MTRQTFDMIWDHIRQMNGIMFRCIAAIPADKIDARPIANMRTPKELVVHTYSTVVQACVVALTTGFVPEDIEEQEPTVCASIRTHDDLMRYCRSAWEAADTSAKAVTDTQLQSIIKTPFGANYPAPALINIVRDELTHHRGQLFVFLRAMNVEPPMMWDFKNNEAAFQPRPKATATA